MMDQLKILFAFEHFRSEIHKCIKINKRVIFNKYLDEKKFLDI